MKKRNGMTLIEIVVSMAVYAVIALVIVNIMTSVNALMRSTQQLNSRLAYEAKYADNLQTKDSQGHDYGASARRIDYVIRYDIRDTGTAKEINSSGSDRAAWEYTAQYDYEKDANGAAITRADKDMHTNVNYRFMSFEKASIARPEWPGDTFTLYVKLVPYFSGRYTGTNPEMAKQFKLNMTPEQIAKAESDAATAIGDHTKITVVDAKLKTGTCSEASPYLVCNSSSMVLNKRYEIKVKNCDESQPDSVSECHDVIKFKVYKYFNTPGKTEQLYAENTVTYYMYNRIGASNANATFYDKCQIEYNVNTGAFNPLESRTENEGDYE
jgi:prepilin-type N-terminal cleavage/methylation domain-containing protein